MKLLGVFAKCGTKCHAKTLWHLQKSMWQKWESNNQFGLNDPINLTCTCFNRPLMYIVLQHTIYKPTL